MKSADELIRISERTLAHYERDPEAFWEGTRAHDVSQNYEALLSNLEGEAPFSILDFGCGPGRDLKYFSSLGHVATGLDACQEFCRMAREHSGCTVLQQNFLELKLIAASFDGVFANASLFHIPSDALRRVLAELRMALKPRGVLFCSNPHGHNEEVWSGDRYACYFDLSTWREHLHASGFDEITHYYRPSNKPRAEQPWLATVWRRRD